MTFSSCKVGWNKKPMICHSSIDYLVQRFDRESIYTIDSKRNVIKGSCKIVSWAFYPRQRLAFVQSQQDSCTRPRQPW